MGSALSNVIIIAILLLLVGGACYYIYKEKKKGAKCIGCPYAGNCAKAKAGLACDVTNKKQ
ncbi:MAG: FeoB-associated Cys-rich membrane protein [Lachnospiraceae bacterium]|nr:FeoB-associated Cys-rich membrane protein [Lachnospiraceae bacterium]